MVTFDYDPRPDSSPETEHLRRLYPTALVIVQAGCNCGCGGPVGRKSKFQPGHDAKLKGKLQRAHAAEAQVLLVGEDGSMLPVTPLSVAGYYGPNWVSIVERGAARIVTRSVTPIAAEKRLARLVEQIEIGEKPDLQLVEFGKWEKTGRAMVILRSVATGKLETRYATDEGTIEILSNFPLVGAAL